MGFKELYLYNFRNYDVLKINIDFPEVYFVGKNGQGKTNILEALYYLCYGSSFRTRNDQIILKNNKTEMSAIATFYDFDKNLSKISIQNKNGLKKITYNEKNITDRRDIISNIPCIVFCHGDLEFVIGSPDKKRLFFDQTLSLLNYDYVKIIRKYKALLKNKNILLKKNANTELISIYNDQIIDTGIEIMAERKALTANFNRIINQLFSKISDLNGQLKIEYISSWKNENREELKKFLSEKISYELKMKTSCYGPHRDNFKFKYDKIDFNEIASTGQLRLLSLILRASQGMFFRKVSGRKPVLLLDDVLLELDPDKRSLFMDNLPEYEQAFFTFLPDSSVIKKHNGIVMNVDNGKVF